MSYLITGATGFLGLHLLRSLAARQPEAELWVVVRERATWARAPHAKEFPQARIIEAQLHETEKIAAALGASAPGHLQGVFHLAAAVHHSRHNGQALFESNVQSTQGMVRLAQRLRARLVFVSTSGTIACHREPGCAVDEEAPYCSATVARWPYYASKIAAERLVQAAAAQGHLQAVILRPPVMLGPGDYRFRATSLIVRYLRGRLPFYLSGGMHFIDIRDAAMAVVRAMELAQPKPVYHLPGHAMPLKTYFEKLQQVSGVAAPKYRLPGRLAQAFAHLTFGKLFDPVVIEMGQHHWDMGSSHAHELGFATRPALETLADTVAFLRKYHVKLMRHDRHQKVGSDVGLTSKKII